jgi:hypothetical protein
MNLFFIYEDLNKQIPNNQKQHKMTTTYTNLSTQFIKDISKTIGIMEKNKLPSCKKQVIPPLFMYIPYCPNKHTKPNKTNIANCVKDFYQNCNTHGVPLECANAIKMKYIISQGRQCCSIEEIYNERCSSINASNAGGRGQSTHANCTKRLQIKKNNKLKTIVAETMADKHLQKHKKKVDGEEDEKESDQCEFSPSLLPVLDSWDDEE